MVELVEHLRSVAGGWPTSGSIIPCTAGSFDGAIVLIIHRLHEGDLTGHVLAQKDPPPGRRAVRASIYHVERKNLTRGSS